MAISNHERIGKSLTLLGQGLYPYVEQHMRAIYGNAWLTQAKSCLSQDCTLKRTIEETLREDVSALLTVITRRWEKVFKPNLSHNERAFASELIDIRNKWAHGVRLSTEDTYRALDSMVRLLSAIGATEERAIADQRQDVFWLLSKEKSRPETSKSQTSTEESRIREQLHELLEEIPFQNALLLYRALTHRSYVFENPTQTEGDNEQLEFLGDSVLEFLAGDYLYEQYPGRSEGELTKRRSNLADHAKVFTVEVRVNGTVYGEGTGNRRKDAEKQAAADALRKLGLP